MSIENQLRQLEGKKFPINSNFSKYSIIEMINEQLDYCILNKETATVEFKVVEGQLRSDGGEKKSITITF